MALVIYPLNNIEYDAEDAAIYNSTRTSGVYTGDDFGFSLSGADNTIQVDIGLAWMRLSKFHGTAVALTAKTTVDMGIPDATHPRIDALVLRYDANKNGGELVAKPGTASSTPLPPERVETEALYELHLLHVIRQPGATAITDADVTDLRLDETYCGLMADAVTRVDTKAINAQVTALIQQLREELAAVKAGTSFVMKTGDTMTGPLRIPAPVENAHAANKEYVDTKSVSATLYSSAWTPSETSGFIQTIEVAGLTDDKKAKAYPARPDTLAEKLALKEETAKVCASSRSGSSMTFECWEETPALDIPIIVEVYV